jgi:hypothetical protein
MFRSLTAAQREQAQTLEGLPALWMTPVQQHLFSAIAAEYGYVLQNDEVEGWRFAVEQAWNAPPPTRPVNGRIRWRWSFGPGLRESAEIHLSDALALRDTGDVAAPARPAATR